MPPLTPEQLAEIPVRLEKLTRSFEETVLADISRRIAKAGTVTDTAEWQLIRLKEMGYANDFIEKALEDYTQKSDEEICRLFFDAGQCSDDFYGSVYSQAGKPFTPLAENAYMQQLIEVGIVQTENELKNFTRSMGFRIKNPDGTTSFKPIAKTYQDALDLAQMQVSTGVFDYNTAIRNAVRTLTDSGLRFVDYETGHVNHADVAVRRAVLTGVSQLTGKISENNAAELDTDIVEVTAHAGARPDHAEWQGRWYSLSGKSKKYPSLVEVTGYGTGAGLKGWNCRHDMYPVIEGISVPSYTEEDLRNIDPPPIEYDGKTYTYYECTQRQRRIETAIRKTKREITGAKASGDEDMFTAKSVLLRRQREEYEKFSEAVGLLTQKERTQVYGFGRSEASKATASYKNILTLGNGDAKIGLRVWQFKKDMADGKINTAVDKSNQQKHINGKAWKNQVKQAIGSGGKITPKSRLAKWIDPQKIIDKYAGTGKDYQYLGNNKYPDEYITLPFTVGVTFNKKTGKYEKTNRVQIKYNEKKGTHIFPISERK